MRTPHETNQNVPANSPRREFLTRSAALFVGAFTAATAATPRLFAKETRKDDRRDDRDSFQVFDCHLHCPAENGEKWQWYMVLALRTEQGELEYVAQKFPKATIAFAHFGDDHEYDDIFRRIDTVANNPNFYLDTSGYGHDRVGVLEYAVKTIGSDRILFGSDFSINDPSTVIARIRNSFLTMEQKQKILSGNLLELLKKVQKT